MVSRHARRSLLRFPLQLTALHLHVRVCSDQLKDTAYANRQLHELCEPCEDIGTSDVETIAWWLPSRLSLLYGERLWRGRAGAVHRSAPVAPVIVPTRVRSGQRR